MAAVGCLDTEKMKQKTDSHWGGPPKDFFGEQGNKETCFPSSLLGGPHWREMEQSLPGLLPRWYSLNCVIQGHATGQGMVFWPTEYTALLASVLNRVRTCPNITRLSINIRSLSGQECYCRWYPVILIIQNLMLDGLLFSSSVEMQ